MVCAKKYMTSKVCHYVNKVSHAANRHIMYITKYVITPNYTLYCPQVRHYVHKWHQKYLWRRKLHQNVKIKKHVTRSKNMESTSKNSSLRRKHTMALNNTSGHKQMLSWRSKVCLDIKGVLWHQKFGAPV